MISRARFSAAVGAVPANLRGIGLMVLSGALYAAMMTIIRWIAAEIHPVEQVFFRILFGLVAVLPFFLAGGLAGMRTTKFGHYGARALIQGSAMAFFYLGLSLIPLAIATTLSMTNAIFVSIGAVLVLRETSVMGRWIAVLAGFAGTVIVINPDIEGINFGALVVVVSAAMYAGLQIHAKLLTRTEPIPHVIAWTLIIAVPFSLLAASFVWVWPSPEQFFWLVMIGVLGTAGNATMTRAFKIGEMVAVAPVWYVRLIWAAILGYLLFAEVPATATWIGAAMIVGAGIYLSRLEVRRARAERGKI
ncbi:MAG: DMT family transporter [Rhodospirillales bacterium]|nr:DMT family transporter [Rhodospirillales bacterium]